MPEMSQRSLTPFTLYLSNRDVTEKIKKPSNAGGGRLHRRSSVLSSHVRLLVSLLCSPAVKDFMCNEAVNNYFCQGNTPLPPNGSLAEAPASLNPSHPDGLVDFKELPPSKAAVQLSVCRCIKITVVMRSWPLCCSLNPEAVSENGGEAACLNEGRFFKVSRYLYNLQSHADNVW